MCFWKALGYFSDEGSIRTCIKWNSFFKALPPHDEGPYCLGILLVAVWHICLFFYPSRSIFLSGEDGFIQPFLGIALRRFFALHQPPEGMVMHIYNTIVGLAAIPVMYCHSFNWTTRLLGVRLGGEGKEGRNTLMGWLSRKLQGCARCLKVYSTCTQRVSICEGDVSIYFLLSVLTVVQSWKTCQQSSGTMPQFAMP